MQTTTDVEKHLRSASDAILLLVSQVAQLERHKRGVRPDDPRFDELARDVRTAAEELADFARQEEAWARDATNPATHATAIIEETAPPKNLRGLLDHWREVERRLQQADPGSEASKRLFGEFVAARDQYMAAFRQRARDD